MTTMNDDQSLSPADLVKLLLRSRIELEIQKQKIEDRISKVDRELINAYLNNPNELGFPLDKSLIPYEGRSYLFSFDFSSEAGSLTVTLTTSTTYTQPLLDENWIYLST